MKQGHIRLKEIQNEGLHINREGTIFSFYFIQIFGELCSIENMFPSIKRPIFIVFRTPACDAEVFQCPLGNKVWKRFMSALQQVKQFLW